MAPSYCCLKRRVNSRCFFLTISLIIIMFGKLIFVCVIMQFWYIPVRDGFYTQDTNYILFFMQIDQNIPLFSQEAVNSSQEFFAKFPFARNFCKLLLCKDETFFTVGIDMDQYCCQLFCLPSHVHFLLCK